MKKVLILAYDFPPYVSVGGLRPAGWAKYLKQHNILPVVVTRQWDDLDGTYLDYIRPSKKKQIEHFINETHEEFRVPFKPSYGNKMLLKYGPERFKKRRTLLNVIHEIGQFFLPFGTKRGIYKQARIVLQKESFDLVIATGDPFVLFHYLKKIKKEFNIPCIADYRDPWSQDVYLQQHNVLSKINRFIEKKTIRNIKHITSVSEFLIANLKDLHGDKNYHIIPNGFDFEHAINVSKIAQNPKEFSIAFVGTICSWYPVELFFETLQDLYLESHFEFKLNLLGIDRADYIDELIQSNYRSIAQFITITPKIPNEQLMEELATNHLLILFNSFSFLGTKIFDYIAVNRKILLLFTEDETTEQLKQLHFKIEERNSISNSLQADMLLECNAGISVRNPKHLKELLLAFRKEFDQNGCVSNESKRIEQFSRQAQTKKLATLIHSITS